MKTDRHAFRIRGRVSDGRVVVDRPLGIPDGTEVLILPADRGLNGAGPQIPPIDLSRFAVPGGPDDLASRHDDDAWGANGDPN